MTALASVAAAGKLAVAPERPDQPEQPAAGRLRQSVCKWCYPRIPLPELARAAKAMGIAGVDLLPPADWEVVRDAGLVCALGSPASRPDFIAAGFNDRKNHAMLLKELEAAIPKAAAMGVPNVIAMFGNRAGKSDAEGAAACVEGLAKIRALAEEQKVTVCVELLNSKVDHKDYQGDRTAFGVAVVRAVDSPRVKLLYDIYHMQIMEGDVIRTMRDNLPYIGHVHTGGVPGRHELDDTQELNWRTIAKVIADAGFAGYVAHEFIPVREPLTSLREAVQLMSV